MVMSLKHLSLGHSQHRKSEAKVSPDTRSCHYSTSSIGAALLVFSKIIHLTHSSLKTEHLLSRYVKIKPLRLTGELPASQDVGPVDHGLRSMRPRVLGSHLPTQRVTRLPPASSTLSYSIFRQHVATPWRPSPLLLILIRGMPFAACKAIPFMGVSLAARKTILTRGMPFAACKTSPPGVSLAARKTSPTGVSLAARKIAPSLAADSSRHTAARQPSAPSADSAQVPTDPPAQPQPAPPRGRSPAPPVERTRHRANACKTRAMQTAMSAAREHALSIKVLAQGLCPADIRLGDTAVLLASPQTPVALHGLLARVVGFSPGRVQLTMLSHGLAVSVSTEVSHFLINLKLVGLPHDSYTTVRDLRRDTYSVLPHHVVTYILDMTTRSGRYHALRALTTPGKERHLLNAIFDCGANIFISSHRGVFDRLRKCVTPTLVSVCGDGIEVLCTHWGYVTMTVGKERRTFEGFYCAYATDTTIVPAGWWDTLPAGTLRRQYYFRGRNHTLELWREDVNGEELLGSSSRNIEPSEDHSDQFRGDLEVVEGQAKLRHALYPIPDAWFEIHQATGSVRTRKARANTTQQTTSSSSSMTGVSAGPGPPAKRGRGRPRRGAPIAAALPAGAGTQVASEPPEAKEEGSGMADPGPVAKAPTADYLDEFTDAALNKPYDVWEKMGPAPQTDEQSSTVHVWTCANDEKQCPQRTLQQLKGLTEYHHARGHRGPAMTASLYEWETGRRLPATVIDNQVRCKPCDLSKIGDRPHRPRSAALPTMVGEEIAADVIVGLPRSLSGFENIGHWHDVKSSYGAVVGSKSKALSKHLWYFIEHFENLVGRRLTRLKIDSGEFKTTFIRAELTKKGTSVNPNLADVHSNQTIERRHRSLKETMRALMAHTSAPECMWEFAVVMANEILNRTPKTKHMQAAGRPSAGNHRPLSPWELVQNKGKHADLKTLWRYMEPIFVRCVYYIENPQRTNHEERGVHGINLGPIANVGNVEYAGYHVLNIETGKVVKARTLTAYPGDFPFRLKRNRQINITSGGESAAESTAIGGTPTPEPASSAAEEEVKYEATVVVKGGRSNMPQRFAAGDIAMTTQGSFEIVKRYPDGDYCARRPGSATASGGNYSIKAKDLWRAQDWPDWDHTEDGKRLGSTFLQQVQKEPRLVLPKSVWNEDVIKGKGYEVLPTRAVAGPAGNTRARAQQAKVADLFKRFDEATNTYVLARHSGSSRARAMKITKRSQSVPHAPEHWPLVMTEAELKKMEALTISPYLPRHYHQIHRSPLRLACEHGQVKELQECLNREVFGKPVLRGKDWVVIGLMWVYTVKARDEMYERVRSRITLMGNQEKTDLSPWQAYAPVAQVATGRIMVAMHLGSPGVRFRKIDVKNAYINENMRRTVYTKMPPGYSVYVSSDGTLQLRALKPGEKHDPDVCLPLQKALYGGMECGRIFWEAWTDWHLNHGFTIIHEERCYLIKHGENGDFIKMAYHVDDNMIAQRGAAFYAQYLLDLGERFDVTEEELTENLGIRYAFTIEDSVHVCRITQTPQIKKFLQEFDMSDCKPASTPCLGGVLPCEADCEEPYDGDWDMESFVGHGTYLQMCTRPDIALIMKLLSRFTKKFGHKHVMWAKHLLRYLKGTSSLGLTYRSGFPLQVQVYTDASHASCVDTRRSILSMVVKYAGNTIFWKSCFSSIVSHSSTESELMALDMGATICEGLRWLTESMGGPMQEAIPIFVDNTGTITISQNPVQAGRNLHVHARYFYVRDLAYAGSVQVVHLPTDQQVADVGCTFKGGPSFLALRGYLMECARVLQDEHGNPRWEFLEVALAGSRR